MSHQRTLSPGGRRLTNPARVSEPSQDTYRYQSHNSYTSPRTSVGVIPISTQTFVNNPPHHSSQAVDSYSGRPTESSTGRPRRSSVSDNQRSSGKTGSVTSRSRPTVVQNDYGRSTSPPKNSREKDYYVTPAMTNEPRKVEHRKVYSVSEGTANLVAAVESSPVNERHHKRRESGSSRSTGHDRSRQSYHRTGPDTSRNMSVDDDDAYSYTNAAGMYADTEPRWRPRRGSVDRGSAIRERPVSMVDPDPRRSTRDIGPPPSTRQWDRINNNLGRARSVRDGPGRDVPQSPTGARVPTSPTRSRIPQSPPRGLTVPQSPTRGHYLQVGASGDPGDQYYVRPRANSTDRRNLTVNKDRGGLPAYDDKRDSRHHERRNSHSQKPDQSVERRGFGIRNDSQDRYARGSEESFGRQGSKYRESAFTTNDSHRNDPSVDHTYEDDRRYESDRQDWVQSDLRSTQRDRDALDKDRNYIRDYDLQSRDRDKDINRERERERERMMNPPRDYELHRHHSRRNSNRERDYGRRENDIGDGSDGMSHSVASTAIESAAAGAAVLGAGKILTDREKGRERTRDAPYEKARDYEQDRSPPRNWDQHSEEGSYDRQRGTHLNSTSDYGRGLGFAFENPAEDQKPSSNAQAQPEPTRHDHVDKQDFEAQHGEPVGNSDVHNTTISAEEDYRRRVEQARRELGHDPNDHGSDSDPDRERRRRERAQRQREKEERASMSNDEYDTILPAPGRVYDSVAPPPPAPMSQAGITNGFESDSYEGSTTSRTPTLMRKPSILDEPMTSEPAQIIDNSFSDKRENRVRIVDPPTEEEERRPRGILKKPTDKFPEDPNAVREGVARMKDAKGGRGIPPGARWTKIDRKLVNPQALEEAKERYEERLECVIVLRVLTREEIQKLADRTREIRDERYDEHQERRSARRRERRDRLDQDEYIDEDSEDEFKPRTPKMLEAPAPSASIASSSAAGTSTTVTATGGSHDYDSSSQQQDFVRDSREHRGPDHRSSRDYSGHNGGGGDRQYMSGGLGER